MMIAWLVVIGCWGYGFGYEGYDSGKIYFGVYTPQAEYGWVVTDREIYLDTVLEKVQK